MDSHPWTKYEVARARDEERLLPRDGRIQGAPGADGGAIDPVVESRSGRTRLLDRLLRRDIGAVRTPARPAV